MGLFAKLFSKNKKLTITKKQQKLVSLFTPYFSDRVSPRSEEHTSELQSHHDHVSRLLLEKIIRGPSMKRL